MNINHLLKMWITISDYFSCKFAIVNFSFRFADIFKPITICNKN